MRWVAWALVTSSVLFVTADVSADFPADPTLDDLKKIAAKPHSLELKLDELKIYPAIRNLQVKATVIFADGQPIESEFNAFDKWVDGKYVVSTFRVPENNEDVWMVVTFDQESEIYRKWVFTDDAIVVTMVGTRVGDTRTISWGSITSEEDSAMRLIISQETHTDDATQWNEIHLIDGRVRMRNQGRATAKP